MTSAKHAWWLVAVTTTVLFTSAALAAEQQAAADDEVPERSLTLDVATVARLGVVTAPLQAVQFQPETHGFGVVVAFDMLAQTDADLATAESALQASQAALIRARALFAAETSVSRQAVEAAQRQANADAAQLTLAQRRAISAWGRGLPWRDASERRPLFARLSSGDAVLIRVTLPSASLGNAVPQSLRVQRVDAQAGAESWTAAKVWNAPADPTVPGRSFFALIDRANGLLPGERLLVALSEGKAQQGAVVPAPAVLIAEGQAWYYAAEIIPLIIPLAPLEDFTRHRIDLGRPVANGYFVSDAQPGQSVVVDGAGLLLARETGTATEEE